MSTPEFSYPLTPPEPAPPTTDPSPPSPEAGSPSKDDPGDPCKLLLKAKDDIIPECDNVHFGTKKCTVDWVYFNNARCGQAAKPYQNGIGFPGTYFRSSDDKGFFRIEGVEEAKVGEANLYSYVGAGTAFEVYMYKDGLNLKGLLGGQAGKSESCHIKIYKSEQQTEIDFQGVTNLSSEGAQIFKSSLYKQTIEAFVKKYDYDQEWVGLEANVSKSFAWGGLDQSNFYRLMYDNTNPPRGFLEIIKGGYTTYLQLQVQEEKVNLYAQLQSSDYHFGIEATSQKVEEILYFSTKTVRLKADNTEASTYNSYQGGEYATLVSRNGEDFLYLKGMGNGHSFFESKYGEARLWGSADDGQDYFDISTYGQTYLQLSNQENRLYVAPKDIPTNSSNPVDHYASFNKLWWITQDKKVKIAAIISSKEIDLRHLGTCWATYPCVPVEIGPPCFATLTFGGINNDKCRLQDFDVYTGPGPEFELYQYQYGLDLKIANNNEVRAAFYTNGSSTFALDVNATDSAYINAKNAQGNRQAYAHFYSDYNGFVLSNDFQQCYMTADTKYRYLVLQNDTAANWRTAAGNTTADTTVYTVDGQKQVYFGVSNSQSAMQFYAKGGTNQMFGYANESLVQWQGNVSDSYTLMKTDTSESKFQTSKGGNYTYHFSSATAAESSLVSSDRSVYNASAGSANWSVVVEGADVEAFWQGNGGQVDINTDDANNKYIYLREIDVCIDGEKKKMMILASDPY